MNQAEVTKLMSQLKIAVAPRHRRMRNPLGPEGRLLKLRKSVTALFKYERLEMMWNRADETRGYAERVSRAITKIFYRGWITKKIFQLISDAIRHGDKHKPTMEMADYWILDKTVVHKLFKVICPRFENSTQPATRMFKAPREYPCVDINQRYRARSILELRGNPFPPVVPDMYQRNRNLLHNVLLEEAKKDFRKEKAAKSEDAVTKEQVEEIKQWKMIFICAS